MKHWKPIKLEELSKDTQKVYDVLNRESDLACVLIGTSYLAELLASALTEKFAKTSIAEKLLDPQRGAVGGFATRADLAYCLGFIRKPVYQDLIKIAELPFISLFIGLLTTALIQSSSTVTSIAVAMVASGTISLDSGIFVIMGANIGTTLTSDIISLSYITNKSKFRLAISAGVVHDFFNILTVIIIFPLEVYSNNCRVVFSTQPVGLLN